ncbi:hypothetical protein K440DRAFT_621176 [Wilcoxina mikolae CBS 423.85]|nr:hypothetical protein K440DRAFT_621176 [Wilcoxina mikolae CBS 423.85]
MALALAPEISRIITSPYAVSLINLDSTLKAAEPHEIQSWADSHPCAIKALAKVVIDALQYCPYALTVIEKLGIVAQLRDEMLQQKPIILDTLIRNALQDDMNFERFSPVLIALLCNPLPRNFPPPAKLVQFFFKCLDKATKIPDIDTVRPLYVLVANGYEHLALLMTESQSYTFAKRMAGFLTEKKTSDTNVFLIYCLSTLAHMHLASSNGESKPGDRRRAIAEIFQGKKAPTVLNLVINIVIYFTSSETQIGWQIIQMATVIANAISDSVRVNGASSADAANLRILLEKAKTQPDTRVVSEALQFVLALSHITPQPPLNATLQELVQRGRKEETTSMFLLLISVEFFAQDAPEDLIGDMLRSMFKSALSNSDPTHSSYQLLRDRVQFTQQLNEVVPQSPSLRRGVLSVLSMTEFVTLINSLVQNSVNTPTTNNTCGEDEACPWVISNLTNQLQLALCTFILRCALYSQGDEVQLSPVTATSLMEKITGVSGIQHKCPFEHTLNVGTTHDTLSLIEEFASPETRISSRNWRQTLAEGLSRDTNRQHGFIVSAVGEICRDLESRCENVEKPLRAEEEHSRQLQAELDEFKAKYTDVEEQLARCLYNLDYAGEENERLENKLDGAIEKSQEALERVKELEDILETEREESRRTIVGLERDVAEARSAHIEELRIVKVNADQAAMEHIAILNARQDMIDELQGHKKELQKEMDEIKDDLLFLREEKTRLEDNSESLRKQLAETRNDNKAQIDALNGENDILSAERNRLQENVATLEITLSDVRQALDGYKASLGQKILELDRQDMMIDEIVYEKRRQKEQLCLLTQARDELETRILELQTAMEKAIRDGEQKCESLSTELEFRYDQQLSKAKCDHEEEIEKLVVDHETAIGQLKTKLDQTRKDWSKERDAQRTEIRSLNEKLNKFRVIHEEREKEAQNLGRQLLGLMSGSKLDLANLLSSKTSLDSFSEPTTTNSPSLVKLTRNDSNGCAPISPTIVPTRRKSDEFTDERENENPKRSKTTHRSSITPGNQQQAHLKFKAAKTPHRKSEGFVAAADTAKGRESVIIEQPEDMVKETPASPAETDYGTAPVLTSTPKGLDISSHFGWEPPAVERRRGRRKTVPVFQVPVQAQEEEDDVEEEEALKDVPQQWDADETL